MDDDKCQFSSQEEELLYWKRLAKEYKQSVSEAREELDEFQVSSRELESELESQLAQQESKNRELVALNSRLGLDLDLLREKCEVQQTTAHKHASEVEAELAQVKAFKEELQRYIRELEQSNDDLERAKRATVVSLEDFEQRLNLAIERNAFLESELEEKESMHVTVQRLKDEARDLRQELAVTRISPEERNKAPSQSTSTIESDTPPPLPARAAVAAHVDSNKLAENNSFVSSPATPAKSQPAIPYQSGTSHGTPLTPSARISALNIVGDLLRKVGALESKLASCRNFVKEQPRNKSGASSPLLSPRAKRLHRGSGSGLAPGAGGMTQGHVKVTL